MKYHQKDIVEVNFLFPDGTFKPHPAIIVSNDELQNIRLSQETLNVMSYNGWAALSKSILTRLSTRSLNPYSDLSNKIRRKCLADFFLYSEKSCIFALVKHE